ncbi:MAG TPA: hypothetical protein ENI68_12325 [Gammaproteobacteria bacterium]|nr:hypothetical protein [Gammaproteobacteria bacterium]
MTVFMGLLFSLSLYTGGSLSLQSIIATAMKFVLAYFILKTVGTRFVETYINVVVFLAAVSLIGYIIDVMHLFDGLIAKLPTVGEMGYEGVLYTFRHKYHPDRNNSIFFEPGAYQGFLNAALFLIVFARTGFANKKKWIYLTILTTALITTTSTTGFVIFSILYGLFLYKSKLASFSQKVVSIGLAILLTGLFAAKFHSVIVVKLDSYLNPSVARQGWSAENRSFDAKTDLKIFKKHVFGLGYEEYRKEFSAIGRVDATEGSSNGVTSMFANYGLPYALFIFASYYWALRRLLGEIFLTTAAYIMFILFLWGESYYQLAPISLSIIAAAFVYSRIPVKDKLQDGEGNVQQA